MAGPDRPMRKVRGSSVLGNDWELKVRAKIQNSKIANRLISFVEGKISLEPAQVTAGVALLKKVLPDVSFVEHSGEIVTSKVIRTPTVASDIDSWQKQYADQPKPKELN